jgi:hypothetical protein
MMAVVQVLELEEEGKLNLTIKLKKRALQGAYDLALKKKKVGVFSFTDIAHCQEEYGSAAFNSSV